MHIRTSILWIAVSLAVHAALLALPSLSINYFSTKSDKMSVDLVHVASSAQPDMSPSAAPAPKAPASVLQTEYTPQPKQAALKKSPQKPTPKKKLPPPKSTALVPQPDEQAPPLPQEPETSTAHETNAFESAPEPTKSIEQPVLLQESSSAPIATNRQNSLGAQSTEQRSDEDSSTRSSQSPQPLRYLYSPKPLYPRFAQERGWQGDVRLRVKIGITGDVIDILIEESSGHSVLDNAALTTVREWKFHPAHDGMKNVGAEGLLSIHFKLPES